MITGLSDRIEHLQQEGIADRIAYEKSHERALQHMVSTQAATEERFKAAETLNASLLQSMSDLRASMRPQHGNAGVFMGNRPPSSVDREDDSDMNLRHNAMPDRYSDMAVAVDSRNASPAATLAATPGYEMTGQFNASAPATGLRGRQSTEVDRRTTLMPFATPHSLRSSDLPRSVTDGSSIKVTYCSTKKGQSAKLFVKQFEEQAKFVNINLYVPMLLSKCDLNVQSTARRAGDKLPSGRYGVLNHAGATVPVPAGWYDWGEFKKWFLETYHNPDFEKSQMTKVVTMKQDTDSFETYVNRLCTAIDLSGAVYSPSLMKNIMETAMCSELRLHIQSDPQYEHLSVPAYISLATRRDNAMRRAKGTSTGTTKSDPVKDKDRRDRNRAPKGKVKIVGAVAEDKPEKPTPPKVGTKEFKEKYDTEEMRAQNCRYCRSALHTTLYCWRLQIKDNGTGDPANDVPKLTGEFKKNFTADFPDGWELRDGSTVVASIERHGIVQMERDLDSTHADMAVEEGAADLCSLCPPFVHAEQYEFGADDNAPLECANICAVAKRAPEAGWRLVVDQSAPLPATTEDKPPKDKTGRMRESGTAGRRELSREHEAPFSTHRALLRDALEQANDKAGFPPLKPPREPPASSSTVAPCYVPEASLGAGYPATDLHEDAGYPAEDTDSDDGLDYESAEEHDQNAAERGVTTKTVVYHYVDDGAVEFTYERPHPRTDAKDAKFMHSLRKSSRAKKDAPKFDPGTFEAASAWQEPVPLPDQAPVAAPPPTVASPPAGEDSFKDMLETDEPLKPDEQIEIGSAKQPVTPSELKVALKELVKYSNVLESGSRIVCHLIVGGVPCRGLLDTGADINAISGKMVDNFAEQLAKYTTTKVTAGPLEAIGGTQLSNNRDLVNVPVSIGEWKGKVDFSVIDGMSPGGVQLILGNCFLKDNGCTLNYEKDAANTVTIASTRGNGVTHVLRIDKDKKGGKHGALGQLVRNVNTLMTGPYELDRVDGTDAASEIPLGVYSLPVPKQICMISAKGIQAASVASFGDCPHPSPHNVMGGADEQCHGQLDHHDGNIVDIEVVSHRQMKKLQHKARRHAAKFEANSDVSSGIFRNSNGSLNKKAILSVMLVVAAAGAIDTTEPTVATAVQLVACLTTVASSMIRPLVGAVSSMASSSAGAVKSFVTGNSARPVVKMYSSGSGPVGEYNDNPFLPDKTAMLSKVNVTIPECQPLVDGFLKEGYTCFNEVPHKSVVARPPEECMTITMKPGKEDFVWPNRSYRVPAAYRGQLKTILASLINKGMIRPSMSPYSSPFILVPKMHQDPSIAKSDLKLRMCIDYSALNKVCVSQHHRIPNISTTWTTLAKAKVFSLLDLVDSFFQENMHPTDGSIAKTAFLTDFGHFEWVSAPQGFKNTPAFFQASIERRLRQHGLIDVGILAYNDDGKVTINDARACCSPYIDDIVVYSDSYKQHLLDLRRVAVCLSENQFHCRAEKCKFFVEYVMFAGGICGGGTLSMNPEKVKAVSDWKRPNTITDLRGFLGLCNYLKQWFVDYSEIAAPLNALLKKDKYITDWDSECDASFAALKAGFASYIILRLPKFDEPFVVITDSCKTALGGGVFQEYKAPDGSLQLLPVMYHSRAFSKHEFNYPVREQECLAIVDTVRKADFLLRGSAFEIVIHTDHSTLRQLSDNKGNTQLQGRMARWAEFLGGFNYRIMWIPGRTNIWGDSISRSLQLPPSGLENVTELSNCEIGAKSVGSVTSLHAKGTHNVMLPQVCAVAAKYDERYDGVTAASYATCPDFSRIYSHMKMPVLPLESVQKAKYYSLRGDKLFYVHHDGTMALCIPTNSRVNQTVKGVTTSVLLRHVAVQECHDSPYVGHRGTVKTCAAMRSLFYWPRMSKLVDRYIRSCTTCARSKVSRRGEMGALTPNEVPLGPMYSISMDFITGLPEISVAEAVYSMVLVIVDRFSKKLWALCVATGTSAEALALRLYQEIFREHGYPLQIISDRGSTFMSKVWGDIFKAVGTQLSPSYANHQRFDGQSESMIQVLGDVLRCYTNFEQTNWKTIIPDAVCAINNSTGPGTYYSANHVYYGRQPFRPVDLEYRVPLHTATVKEFIEQTEHIRHIAVEAVRASIIKYTSANLKLGASRPVDPRLQVGALVMVNAKNITLPGHSARKSSKLQAKKAGPFKIVEKISTTGFRLDMPGYKHTKIFHATNLTFFQPAPEFVNRTAAPEPDVPASLMDDGWDKWVVSELASKRTIRGKPKFFVVYEGSHADEGEWILRSDLIRPDFCRDMVLAYEAKHGMGDSKLLKPTKKRGGRRRRPP